MRFRLKDFRQAHGLYQSDMAELLGLTQSTVSRAELKEEGIELSYPQRLTLFEKYGEEDVTAFFLEDEKEKKKNAAVKAAEKEMQKNGGVILDGSLLLGIINEQSATITNLSRKMAEQTDRILEIIEKLSEKL